MILLICRHFDIVDSWKLFILWLQENSLASQGVQGLVEVSIPYINRCFRCSWELKLILFCLLFWWAMWAMGLLFVYNICKNHKWIIFKIFHFEYDFLNFSKILIREKVIFSSHELFWSLFVRHPSVCLSFSLSLSVFL